MNKNEELLKIYIKYIESSSNELIRKLINFDSIHHIIIDNYICKCRELTWKEASEIDYKSFVKFDKDYIFNSENEKRLIIEKSLLEIQDHNKESIKFELSNLSYDFVEKYWKEYQKYLHLDLEEVNLITNSAKKYFNSSNSEYFPVHPLIIQIDYMLKGIVNYNKQEFENLTVREFEAIQSILAIKNSM